MEENEPKSPTASSPDPVPEEPVVADPVARFRGLGTNFRAKLIGVDDVPDSRGDQMCQESIIKLKASVLASGRHKQKIIVNVSLEGIKIVDVLSGEVQHVHPVHRISFIARDTTDRRAFGYVYGAGEGRHQFYGIKTAKAAEGLVLALRDLFQVVYDMKKKEMDEAKATQKESDESPSQPGNEEPSAVTPQVPPNNDNILDLKQQLTSIQEGINTMDAIGPWSGDGNNVPESSSEQNQDLFGLNLSDISSLSSDLSCSSNLLIDYGVAGGRHSFLDKSSRKNSAGQVVNSLNGVQPATIIKNGKFPTASHSTRDSVHSVESIKTFDNTVCINSENHTRTEKSTPVSQDSGNSSPSLASYCDKVSTWNKLCTGAEDTSATLTSKSHKFDSDENESLSQSDFIHWGGNELKGEASSASLNGFDAFGLEDGFHVSSVTSMFDSESLEGISEGFGVDPFIVPQQLHGVDTEAKNATEYHVASSQDGFGGDAFNVTNGSNEQGDEDSKSDTVTPTVSATSSFYADTSTSASEAQSGSRKIDIKSSDSETAFSDGFDVDPFSMSGSDKFPASKQVAIAHEDFDVDPFALTEDSLKAMDDSIFHYNDLEDPFSNVEDVFDEADNEIHTPEEDVDGLNGVNTPKHPVVMPNKQIIPPAIPPRRLVKKKDASPPLQFLSKGDSTATLNDLPPLDESPPPIPKRPPALLKAETTTQAPQQNSFSDELFNLEAPVAQPPPQPGAKLTNDQILSGFGGQQQQQQQQQFYGMPGAVPQGMPFQAAQVPGHAGYPAAAYAQLGAFPSGPSPAIPPRPGAMRPATNSTLPQGSNQNPFGDSFAGQAPMLAPVASTASNNGLGKQEPTGRPDPFANLIPGMSSTSSTSTDKKDMFKNFQMSKPPQPPPRTNPPAPKAAEPAAEVPKPQSSFENYLFSSVGGVPVNDEANAPANGMDPFGDLMGATNTSTSQPLDFMQNGDNSTSLFG